MADQRISELTAATSLADADLIPIVQAGDTKKLTGAALKAYTALGYTAESTANKGQANGYASLGSDGKVPSGQIPDLAVVDYLGSVASQAAMLALTGQKGDWCNRSDTGTVFVISGSDPTLIGSWTQLNYPTAPVTSVAGRTGAVTLAKADVGLGNVDNTSDANKPISTATQTALDAKQALDADLTAIAALAGTSGILKKTAANTWSLDTNTYLTSAVTSVSGTAPIVSSGGTTPAISISAATTLAAGSMSAADKTKLDGVATGATANTGTVTSVGGTGTVSGLTLTGTVTTSGSLTLGGTLAVTPSNFASQTAATVLAAPNAAAGAPTFRALVAADIPTLNQNTTGTASNVTGTVALANGGTGGTTAATARTNLGLGTAATMTGPTGTIVGTTDTQTLTNKTLTGYTETVYNLTGTDISPANGTIQYKTLSANTTFTESLADGQSVTLMLNPSTFTATWPTTTWIGSVASTAPTLIASVYNCITFFQFGATLYGKYEGRV